jgi:hypothetical protein
MTSPALGSNMPTRAESDRAATVEHRAQALTREVVHQLLWLFRHDVLDEKAIQDAVSALVQQEFVYVARVDPCTCGASGTVAVVEWRATEAQRDAASDLLLSDVVGPGDTMTLYTLRVPSALGTLPDSSVQRWVDEVPVTDAGVSDLLPHRYGECPHCGATEYPIDEDAALDRVADLLSLPDSELRAGLVRTLRAAGRDPMSATVEEFYRVGDEPAEWMLDEAREEEFAQRSGWYGLGFEEA